MRRSPKARMEGGTYEKISMESRVLVIHSSRLKGRCEASPLYLPPFLVHLCEQCAPAEGLEAGVLSRELGPVLVGDLADKVGVTNVDDPREQSVPLAHVSSAHQLAAECRNVLSDKQGRIRGANVATVHGHPPSSSPKGFLTRSL